MNKKAKAEAKKIIHEFYKEIKEYPAEIYPDDIELQIAKQCAIIYVNKMLEEIKFSRDYIPEYFWKTRDKHWRKIKEELEKS